MFITSEGEPKVIHWEWSGYAETWVFAVFHSAQIVKLYEGGYTVEYIAWLLSYEEED